MLVIVRHIMLFFQKGRTWLALCFTAYFTISTVSELERSPSPNSRAKEVRASLGMSKAPSSGFDFGGKKQNEII